MSGIEFYDGYIRGREDNLQWVMQVAIDGTPAKKVVPIAPIMPYFYVAKKANFSPTGITLALDLPQDAVRIVDDGRRSWDGEELVRLEMPNPWIINKVRQHLGAENTYEADLPYNRRAFIDTAQEISLPPKRFKAYFDIEVDTSEGTPDVKKATARIICISLVGANGTEEVFCEDDEEQLIRKFIRATKKYRTLSGWFSNRFDMPYLEKRIKNINPRIWSEENFTMRDLIHIDLVAVYRDILLSPAPYSLEAVCQKELGRGKVEVKKSKLHELFENDRELLMKYNLEDSRLCKDLDAKFTMMDIVWRLSQMSRCPVPAMFRKWWFKTGTGKLREFIISAPIDSLILYMASQRNPRMILPSRKRIEGDDTRKFRGAHVFPTVPGIHQFVINLDFRSLYPSIIQSWNMGFETIRMDGSGDLKALFGSFISEPRSLLSEMLEVANTERMKYLRLREGEEPDSSQWKAYHAIQWAWKTIRNAAYGVQGSVYSRYYDRNVAENVTQIGKELIILAAEEAQAMGFKLIAGDTDSLLLRIENIPDESFLPTIAQTLGEMLTAKVVKHCEEKYGIINPEITLEVDKIFRSVLFTKKKGSKEGRGVKKKYAGLVMWQDGKETDHLKVVGFETVRYDWSRAARDFQSKLLMKLLRGVSSQEIVGFIADTKKRVLAGELDEQLVQFKGLNKEIEAYKVVPPHLRAAKMLIKQGHPVQRGDKIGFIKWGKKPEELTAIPPEEAPKLGLKPMAYSYIWSKQFTPICERLEVEEHIRRTLSEFATEE